MKYGEEITFEDFLNDLQLTEESYILAIRQPKEGDIMFEKGTI